MTLMRSMIAAIPMGQPPLPSIKVLIRLIAQRRNPRARPTKGKKGKELLWMDVSLPGTGKMVRVLKAVTSPRSM
jgi:hypothetical protein